MIFYDFQLQVTMWFQNHHNSFFNTIFKVFTELGDVTFLLLVFMFIYWNVSKDGGLRLIFGMALSFGVNTGIKESVRNLRPFYTEGISSGLTKEVSGYSFPSGHSQNAGTFWTLIIKQMNNNWVTSLGVIMMIMVPLSRLYLRVHWLQDVIVGLSLGIIIALIYDKFLANVLLKFFTHSLVITFMTPFSFFIMLLVNNDDVAKAFGVFAGILFGYWFENKYVGFTSQGTTKEKLVRFLLGSMGLIVLQQVLKLIFSDKVMMDYVRYYIIGIYITFVAPFVFYKIQNKRSKILNH